MCSLSADIDRSSSRSADAAGDVVLRLLVLGIGEDVVGLAFLDQVAEVEERGLLADARAPAAWSASR